MRPREELRGRIERLPRFASVLVVGMAAAVAIARAQAPAAVDAAHDGLARQLSTAQAAAIRAVYPDFRLIAVCRGRFSAATGELVAGIWTPIEPERQTRRRLRRVGLVREGAGWTVHVIDDELEQDAAVTRSYPFTWDARVDAAAVDARMTCGVEPGHDPHIDGHGRRLFDRRRAGLQRSTVVCFATSDVYNNWDCVLYSAADRRFRLWYQQARAD